MKESNIISWILCLLTFAICNCKGNLDIPTNHCYNELLTCKESKCQNCTEFSDCCNDRCSKRPEVFPQENANFICEDDGKILDCKCSNECFQEAVEYRKENCASSNLSSVSRPDEKFRKCCNNFCTEYEKNAPISFGKYSFTGCIHDSNVLPTCTCSRFLPTNNCSTAFAVCKEWRNLFNCSENEKCCSDFCRAEGFDDNLQIQVYPNEPYCACAMVVGSFGYPDKLYPLPTLPLTHPSIPYHNGNQTLITQSRMISAANPINAALFTFVLGLIIFYFYA